MGVNDLGLDRVDRKILHILQRDAGLSNLELAERVGLSPTPCARRVKRLWAEGVMTHQVAMVDPEKAGSPSHCACERHHGPAYSGSLRSV
jgi:Lrp/AsnC family leucine-responsive transcriptional regulator